MEVTCATDLIAISWLTILVNADAMTKDNREILLYGFYRERETIETLLVFGVSEVPAELHRIVRTYHSIQDAGENLKYIILTAYHKKKNSEKFSATLA